MQLGGDQKGIETETRRVEWSGDKREGGSMSREMGEERMIERVREREIERRLGDESVGYHGLETNGIIRGLYIGKHHQE